MPNPIFVICDNRNAMSYLSNIYYLHHKSEIEKVVRFTFHILLKDGTYIFFIKNRSLKRYLKKYPHGMIVSENKFVESFLI